MIKQILQDIVSHFAPLGISLIKATTVDGVTTFEASIEENVVVYATVREPIPGFRGTFGLPNLEVLNTHLKCPEYAEDAVIEVREGIRLGSDTPMPCTIRFENKTGDFFNDYQFMSEHLANEAVRTLKCAVSSWDISFEPETSSITKLKYQSLANSSEPWFQLYPKGNQIMCKFGDELTHNGGFVFHTLASGALKHSNFFLVQPVLQIFSFVGNKTIDMLHQGLLQITVDTGIVEYRYMLTTQSK